MCLSCRGFRLFGFCCRRRFPERFSLSLGGTERRLERFCCGLRICCRRQLGLRRRLCLSCRGKRGFSSRYRFPKRFSLSLGGTERRLKLCYTRTARSVPARFRRRLSRRRLCHRLLPRRRRRLCHRLLPRRRRLCHRLLPRRRRRLCPRLRERSRHLYLGLLRGLSPRGGGCLCCARRLRSLQLDLIPRGRCRRIRDLHLPRCRLRIRLGSLHGCGGVADGCRRFGSRLLDHPPRLRRELLLYDRRLGRRLQLIRLGRRL